ncbi:cyclophilin-like fold protein [Pedococcus sp. 5OH_020]|uniref:cyclophilin-like fold protein n=1 Tax=Pedococcus sp. 5OH_020 TaxID=2989814 RepID=UPI0022E9BC5B|nr:cyclophilin-like fold protein [Pedococcus sp. 5OH_020]
MTLLLGRCAGLAIGALSLGLSSCAVDDPQSASPPPAPTATSATTQASSAGSTGPTSSGTSDEESPLQIQVQIGNQRFTAQLDDSAASRDLVAQLPVTLEMRDHGSVEKTGRLPSPLSLTGQPAGADPDIGDVGYYAPGNNLVLYYGDQSYYNGIVVLGRLEGGAAGRIAALQGTVRVTVSVPDQ